MSLNSNIEEIAPRLNDYQKGALKKLGIKTIEDLLYHFPSRYDDKSEFRPINTLQKGDNAVIYGKISKLKTSKAFRKKIPMAEGFIEDATGRIKIIWFHQPYIAKMLGEGAEVKITGKIAERKGELYVTNPNIETGLSANSSPNSIFSGKESSENLLAVYPESRGITSNWFSEKIKRIIKEGILEGLEDPIPKEILKKYNLPDLKTSLFWIHMPKYAKDARGARKRFAFEEVVVIQIKKHQQRLEYKNNPSFVINKNKSDLENLIDKFPFQMTPSQEKTIDEILLDFSRNKPMTRLLEGDVVSGKTAVAAAATYAVTNSRPLGKDFGNLQTAYMVPTEILAKQHFESFIKYFSHLSVNIGLITSSGCRKFPSKVNPSGWTDISRSQFLKWVANGEIAVVVGTHALIQKSVKFKHLAFAIIDEQHRFGTAQRQKLVSKEGLAPHLLSMTATPIPRTLALTIYGDLDLSLLSEMPEGRKEIITEIIKPSGREQTYEKIREELTAGRQLYVICPRIFEADPEKELALNVKSVVAEAKILKKEIFREYEIAILHSKMSKEKKEGVMKDFSDGKINILCATSVVEVGVNVPNATMIIIEGAERFGLAQLHQLRGRVIRSTHQAYCYIFAEAKSEKTIARLKALKTAKNGFELAELDLTLRGAGELAGTKQWGITDLGMEAIKNIKMVEAARTEAIRLIEEDPELSKYPLLKQKVKSKVSEFHFE